MAGINDELPYTIFDPNWLKKEVSYLISKYGEVEGIEKFALKILTRWGVENVDLAQDLGGGIYAEKDGKRYAITVKAMDEEGNFVIKERMPSFAYDQMGLIHLFMFIDPDGGWAMYQFVEGGGLPVK